MTIPNPNDYELALAFMHKHAFPIDLDTWIELVWGGDPPIRDQAFWAKVPSAIRPLHALAATEKRSSTTRSEGEVSK